MLTLRNDEHEVNLDCDVEYYQGWCQHEVSQPSRKRYLGYRVARPPVLSRSWRSYMEQGVESANDHRLLAFAITGSDYGLSGIPCTLEERVTAGKRSGTADDLDERWGRSSASMRRQRSKGRPWSLQYFEPGFQGVSVGDSRYIAGRSNIYRWRYGLRWFSWSERPARSHCPRGLTALSEDNRRLSSGRNVKEPTAKMFPAVRGHLQIITCVKEVAYGQGISWAARA